MKVHIHAKTQSIPGTADGEIISEIVLAKEIPQRDLDVARLAFEKAFKKIFDHEIDVVYCWGELHGQGLICTPIDNLK